MDASLRGDGGEPVIKFVRLIHCKGGTGVLVEMLCAETRRREREEIKRSKVLEAVNRERGQSPSSFPILQEIVEVRWALRRPCSQ